MANEIVKEIKTRIALRTGDYAYWTTGAGKDIELLKGEVCVCTIAVADNQAQTAPTVLFKVCDIAGKKFADLKWTSALAADVYEWAKTANLYIETDGAGNAITSVSWDATLNGNKGGLKFTKGETFATKDELDELREGLEADTNTTYNFSIPTTGEDKGKLLVEKKEIGETSWTKVDAYDFVTPGELDEILNGKIHTEEEIKAMEIAHATAAGKVDTAITVKVGGTDVVFDGSEAKTADVDAAIAAAIDAIPDVVHPEYSIVKDPTSEYAATYHLTKDGVNVGAAINIPKDMVVEHGEVVENPEGQPEGTYIELKLQNVTEPLYINVGELIEYVTGGNTADIEVSVDSITHVVTATLTKTVTDNIALGVTAHSWGNHAEAGYATAISVTDITKDNGVIDSKITAYDTSKNFGDIITHNADEFATSEQGGKADSALQEVEVGTGLKVSDKSANKQTIDIDTDVVFVLDCNW